MSVYKDLKVLVVDDESLVLGMLGTLLSELQIKDITKATNGEQAIMAHNSKIIDVTFLDIEMPGKNGLDTLKEIRKINKDAYVIILSGSSTVQNVKGALSAGAKTFIAKPYTANKIIKALKGYTDQKNNPDKS